MLGGAGPDRWALQRCAVRLAGVALTAESFRETDALACALRSGSGIGNAATLTCDDLLRIGGFVGIVGVERFGGKSVRHLGELLESGDGLVVRVRRDVSEKQFLFTIAHEIGHALMYQSGFGRPERVVVRTAKEEQFADRVARLLLAPLSVLDSLARELSPFDSDMDAVRLLGNSGLLGIPPWQFFAHLAESGTWGCRVAVRWEVESGDVARAVSFAKFPGRKHFVALGKSARDVPGDRNGYVWRFLRGGVARVPNASPHVGGIVGRWSIVGACLRGFRDCGCVYRPEENEKE